MFKGLYCGLTKKDNHENSRMDIDSTWNCNDPH